LKKKKCWVRERRGEKRKGKERGGGRGECALISYLEGEGRPKPAAYNRKGKKKKKAEPALIVSPNLVEGGGEKEGGD